MQQLSPCECRKCCSNQISSTILLHSFFEYGNRFYLRNVCGPTRFSFNIVNNGLKHLLGCVNFTETLQHFDFLLPRDICTFPLQVMAAPLAPVKTHHWCTVGHFLNLLAPPSVTRRVYSLSFSLHCIFAAVEGVASCGFVPCSVESGREYLRDSSCWG